jgi:hypothetical protein
MTLTTMPLADIQDASYVPADRALLTSWPRDRMMPAEALDQFLADRRYCVLATTSKNGHPQARPVGFAVVDEVIWFATVSGGRLRNLERVPWTSMVVSEGEGDTHRAFAADGPVKIHEHAPHKVVVAWEARFGSRGEWAAAWVELHPKRVFSYAAQPDQ